MKIKKLDEISLKKISGGDLKWEIENIQGRASKKDILLKDKLELSLQRIQHALDNAEEVYKTSIYVGNQQDIASSRQSVDMILEMRSKEIDKIYKTKKFRILIIND